MKSEKQNPLTSIVEVVRDDKNPLHSPITRMVASAKAAGFNWGAEAHYADGFEKKDDGSVERTVTWVLDGGKKAHFAWAENDGGRWILREEWINFKTFKERYMDIDWVEANPDHPISYMRVSHRAHIEFSKSIKKLPKQEIIRKGKKTGMIPETASDEERAKIYKGIGIRTK